MRATRPSQFLAAACLLACACGVARADWPTDPATGGLLLSDGPGMQFALSSVADGAGGAYFAYEDRRNGPFADIVYVQHVDASGHRLWGTQGQPVSNGSPRQESPRIVTDEAGGAIVTWVEFRADTAGDLYAQRFDALGAPQWTADGVVLCAVPMKHVRLPVAAADGAGGAVAAWQDDRNAAGPQVYAARVDHGGLVPWTADGMAVAPGQVPQYEPALAPAGSWGVLMAWRWYDGTPNSAGIAYAQRFTTSGAGAWPAPGVRLCDDSAGQSGTVLASDGLGGAYAAWSDNRLHNSWQLIYAQRVAPDGTRLWAADGLFASGGAYPFFSPQVVADPAGGAYVGWNGTNYGIRHVFLQHVASNGTPEWNANGDEIGTVNESSNAFGWCAIADGSGGVLAAWDGQAASGYETFVARINSAGSRTWLTAVAASPSWMFVQSLVRDGANGAIVGWLDLRSGTIWDVYAAQVSATGDVGTPSIVSVPPGGPAMRLAAPWPSPARAGSAIAFALEVPRAGTVRLALCDAAGRRVRTLVARAGGAGPVTLRWDGRDGEGRAAPPGLYVAWALAGTDAASAKFVLTP